MILTETVMLAVPSLLVTIPFLLVTMMSFLMPSLSPSEIFDSALPTPPRRPPTFPHACHPVNPALDFCFSTSLELTGLFLCHGLLTSPGSSGSSPAPASAEWPVSGIVARQNGGRRQSPCSLYYLGED